jgi:hypothetical protein
MASDENEVRWLAERLHCTLWSDGNGYYMLERDLWGPLVHGAGSLDEIEERIRFCLEFHQARTATEGLRTKHAVVDKRDGKRRKQVTRARRR